MRAVESTPDRERLSLTTSGAVNNYSMFFRDGRFCISIPRATFENFQDELRGALFRDAVVERRNDTLVISFVLTPATSVRIIEKPTGLDLLLTLAHEN